MRHISTIFGQKAPEAILDRILRVNQAGELAAHMIYKAQWHILGRTSSGPIIHAMWEQEKRHLEQFNKLVEKHNIRPSALTPLWTVMSYGMGATTALLGKEAAMACTEAVETVVGAHYAQQLQELSDSNMNVSHSEVVHIIRQSLNDELEHLHTAVEHDAHRASIYHAYTHRYIYIMLLY